MAEVIMLSNTIKSFIQIVNLLKCVHNKTVFMIPNINIALTHTMIKDFVQERYNTYTISFNLILYIKYIQCIYIG